MPKNIFIEILSKRLFLELLVIICVNGINNLIIFKLGLKLNHIHKRTITLWPYITIGVVYSIVGKQMLPDVFFPLGSIILLSAMLSLLSKLPFFKAFFSIVLILLFGNLGVILVLHPLILFKIDLMPYILKNPWGIALGSFFESILPAVLLFVLPQMNCSKQTPATQPAKADFFGKILFAVLFFVIYYLAILFFWLYKNVPNSNLLYILILEIMSFLLALTIFFYITKTEQKKKLLQLEQEQLKAQLDQSHQLVETLSSERRDYRNHLQVMNMLATINNNAELSRYIYDITKQLAVSSIINLDNPILASVIITNQIQAKENGVSVVLQCDTSLKSLTENSVKLAETVQILVKILTDNELLYPEGRKIVFISISQEPDKYIFEFTNSGFSVLNKPKERIYSEQQLKQPMMEKLNKALIIAKELKGCLLFAIQEDYVVWFELLLPKMEPGQ